MEYVYKSWDSYIPGGQTGISPGSLNVVSMSGLLLFLEFLREVAIAECCMVIVT